MSRVPRRTRTPLLLALLGLFLLAPPAPAQAVEETPAPTTRTTPWDAEVLELFAELPVQHGGRIKPLHSFAGLKLLTFNGKRTLKLADGEKLAALPWLLDCLFYPELALTYPCFRVQSDAVLVAAGLEAKSKRAWYSYEELEPARSGLLTQASGYRSIPAKRQTSLQQQTLKLASDLLAFEDLLGSFEPIRRSYPTGTSPALVAVFGEGEQRLDVLLERASALEQVAMSVAEDDAEGRRALQELSDSFRAGLMAGQAGVVFLPPSIPTENNKWWNVSEAAIAVLEKSVTFDAVREWFAALQRLESKKGDTAAFREGLTALHALLVEQAEERGEYGHTRLEVAMNHADPFYRSLLLYLLAFLVAVSTWIVPRSRVLLAGLWGTVGLATLLAALGITLRCVIRGRPPVVSLYDTILFITVTGALFFMVLELFTRLRVALSLSTVFGAVGLFVAARYELKEVVTAGDTMASVMAVLDTNHYLAVHVTTITLGYMAGLVAALAAHVWILGKLVGLMRGEERFYRILSALTYGAICFSLLFSIFGTIYGGKWANDSWGRFWGWDPKENGALLICIWELLILHARFGGYIRDRGLAVLSVLGAIVITASWFGVNLLGVGLHSYGFTSGIARTLYIVWAVELFVVLLAGVDALRNSKSNDPPGAMPRPEEIAGGTDA